MNLPEIEIQLDEPLNVAAGKVDRAFAALGFQLFEFEHLNTAVPTAPRCRFFQTKVEDRECVVLVSTQEWAEDFVIVVLNLMLHIRTDPDPPGPPPIFRFFSAYPVPPVLLGLFGDSSASDFECRAALAIKFGSELSPASAHQMGAVAIHLLRECFGIASGFFDPDGDLRIAQAVTEWFGAGSFPEGAAPLNSLLALGFLYGELLRARSRVTSRWATVRSLGPWPVLIFGADPAHAEDNVPQVVFSPMSSLMNVYQEGSRTLLRESRDAIEAKCRETLRAPRPSDG